MPCYHPLYARHLTDPHIINPKTGKGRLVFLHDRDLDRVLGPSGEVLDPSVMLIPCGKCIGCRLEYSRQWANRLMLELPYHPPETCWFLTLTYNDWHLPLVDSVDPATGEFIQLAALSKRDIQLWLKRLRKAYPEFPIRYYIAGEYGAKTSRPHYHAIVFGLPLDDLCLYQSSEDGNNYYISPKLQKTWSAPTDVSRLPRKGSDTPLAWIGRIIITRVTWDTCAYTARYAAGKQLHSLDTFFQDYGLPPPFCLMSRRPGIGKQWYLDHPESLEHEFISLATREKGLKFPPPKYFSYLQALDDPDAAEVRKSQRRALAQATAANPLRGLSGIGLDHYREIQERAHEARAKQLQRSDF